MQHLYFSDLVLEKPKGRKTKEFFFSHGEVHYYCSGKKVGQCDFIGESKIINFS